MVLLSYQKAPSLSIWFFQTRGYQIYKATLSEKHISHEYRYTVETSTILPIDDHYFLKGYADDFIDDLYLDGLYWQDWEWDMGSMYGAINAWGDGFLYPMGYRQKEPLDVAFTFWEKEDSGLLDFQFISWTHQRDRIGNPRFRAVGSLDQASTTIDSAMFYAGSKWKFEEDPEFSERYFEARHVINCSIGSFEIGLGLGWAEWALLPGTEDDVGITVNFTNTYCIEEDPPWYYWEFSLKDPTIETYSFPALEIKGIEYEEHDSFVRQDLIAAMDYTGTVIMFASTALQGPTPLGILGASVGLGIKGIPAIIKIVEGQQVSRFEQIITDEHHYQVRSQMDWTMRSLGSKSDVLFFKLNPAAGQHCGLIKVVLTAPLWCTFWHYNDSVGWIGDSSLLANIIITISIPWFLRG
jgi:hypothetical protein